MATGFFYFFKVELPADGFICHKAETLPSGETWEMSRYHIERRIGIHDTMRQNKANVNHTAVTGYFYEDWLKAGKRHRDSIPIAANYVMRAGDRVLIFRVALPLNEKPHVPAAILQQEQEKEERLKQEQQQDMWKELSEEDRLSNFLSTPSQFYQQAQRRTPPPGYVCHRCGISGHFKSHCPTLLDSNFVPEIQRRKTTGIPRSLLRKATPEEASTAMIHMDGTLMVPK